MRRARRGFIVENPSHCTQRPAELLKRGSLSD
jgi:hypothetical protein